MGTAPWCRACRHRERWHCGADGCPQQPRPFEGRVFATEQALRESARGTRSSGKLRVVVDELAGWEKDLAQIQERMSKLDPLGPRGAAMGVDIGEIPGRAMFFVDGKSYDSFAALEHALGTKLTFSGEYGYEPSYALLGLEVSKKPPPTLRQLSGFGYGRDLKRWRDENPKPHDWGWGSSAWARIFNSFVIDYNAALCSRGLDRWETDGGACAET